MTQSDDTIFVGREEELTQLMAFAKDAFAGKAGVAFVTGEAGIGKTFLVEEFFRRLGEKYENVVIASGQCTIQSASYLPFRSLLENLLTSQKDTVTEIIHQIGIELLGVFGISSRTVQKPSDGDTARLIQQRDELQHQWDLLSKQLRLLEEERILETRPEEKFRLEHKIEKIKAEREQIGNALSDLEKQFPQQTRVDLSETTIPKDLAPMQVFGWYTKVMQDISNRFPLVVFIDDLHWADDSSLNLLLHLGRETEDQQMLVIGTYRPHEVIANSLLMQVKAKLGRYGAKEFSLDVSEKKSEDIEKTTHFVHDYLIAKYNTNFSDTFEQVLVGRTEGNALFLTEILKNLEEKGEIAADRSNLSLRGSAKQSRPAWQLTTQIERIEDLPEKLENAISERVDRLEATLREILDYASVEGDDFIAQVIAKVRQIQERSLINDLTKKLMKTYQLIWERGGKSLPNGQRIHEFSFKHNLIREYVYSQLSETDKEFIHAEIGECLEKLYEPNADEIASKLAIHFYHAHFLDKTIHYCLKAAQDANKRYGVAEAVRFGKMGIKALEEQKTTLSQEKYADNKIRLLLELAKAEEFGGDPQEEKDHIQAGISYLEENLSLLKGMPDKLSAEFYSQLGSLCYRKGTKKQEAKVYWEKALHFYKRYNDLKSIAEIFYQLGDVYQFVLIDEGEQSPQDKAIKTLKKALAIAEKLQDIELQSKCLSRLAWRNNIKNHSYAEQCAKKALKLSRATERSNNYLEMMAIDAMAVIYLGSTKFKTAIQYNEESLKMSKRIGDVFHEADTLHQLGFIHHFYVTLQEQAQKHLEESLAIKTRIGYRKNTSFGVLGRIFRLRGKWYEAEKCCRNAVSESIGYREVLYKMRMAQIYMSQGNYEQARSEFLENFELFKKYGRSSYLQEHAMIALNYALLGDEEECRKYMEEGQKVFEQIHYLRSQWIYLYTIGEVHRILRELDTAKKVCQQSIESFIKQAEDPEELYDVAEARLIMGKILVDMGEYREAITYLDKAKTAFKICGHYALGETLLYLGKAHQGLGGIMFLTQAKEFVNEALAEFQRLELHHKERETREDLEKLK